MMTDAEKRLMIDLELFYDKWLREWATRVCNDMQPTREDERAHLQEFKKIIIDHVEVDPTSMGGYLK